MTKTLMRDLVIVLPGISGSVLRYKGKDIWAPSAQATWHFLSGDLDKLQLVKEDTGVDDLGDGIRATRLIPDFHRIPGLIWVDGYSKISNRISHHFQLVEGRLEDSSPANFYEFPYDWRRDNRVAARQLKSLIDRQLPAWRKHTYNKDAQVILIGHSMGGLVARYYLEVLKEENWRNCKALITFGTPYRGSLKSLDYLANGYKKLFLDLTDIMRSFTSMYQLLPIYEALRIDGSFKRVAETENIPGVDLQRARDGLEFHREIETAVKKHLDDLEYQKHGYTLIPYVGTRQPTLQSAELQAGRLKTSRVVPDIVSETMGDGDGTVPRVSAIPIELSEEYRETYVPEQHGSLQRNGRVMDDLIERLRHMQTPGLGAIRGPEIKSEPAAIGLDFEDVYLPDEPVVLRAQLFNCTDSSSNLEAAIEPIQESTPTPPPKTFSGEGDQRCVTFDGIAPGSYRVEVRSTDTGLAAPKSVHGLFSVAS